MNGKQNRNKGSAELHIYTTIYHGKQTKHARRRNVFNNTHTFLTYHIFVPYPPLRHLNVFFCGNMFGISLTVLLNLLLLLFLFYTLESNQHNISRSLYCYPVWHVDSNIPNIAMFGSDIYVFFNFCKEILTLISLIQINSYIIYKNKTYSMQITNKRKAHMVGNICIHKAYTTKMIVFFFSLSLSFSHSLFLSSLSYFNTFFKNPFSPIYSYFLYLLLCFNMYLLSFSIFKISHTSLNCY